MRTASPDTPAQVMNGIGETLVQTPPAVALFGDETTRTGLARAVVYRWFTDPESRRVYPEDDHPRHARAFVADLRVASARPHARARAEVVVRALLERSPQFAAIWNGHEVGIAHGPENRLWHLEVGVRPVVPPAASTRMRVTPRSTMGPSPGATTCACPDTNMGCLLPRR